MVASPCCDNVTIVTMFVSVNHSMGLTYHRYPRLLILWSLIGEMVTILDYDWFIFDKNLARMREEAQIKHIPATMTPSARFVYLFHDMTFMGNFQTK